MQAIAIERANRVGVGRILRPQFAGDKRNATTRKPNITGGASTKFTWPILGNSQYSIEIFEIVQWQIRLQMSCYVFMQSDKTLCLDSLFGGLLVDYYHFFIRPWVTNHPAALNATLN